MAIDLVTRREWGARSPRGSYSRLTSTRGVKVHYTGGQVSPDIVDDHARCVAMVKSIQNHHMDGNGWIDVGYSLLVCPHRKVFEGRGLNRVPAANGAGLNSDHYAVLGLVGSSGLTTPNDGMLHGILDAIEYLRDKGGAGREIKGHRDGYSTSCPGEPLYTWVRKGAPRPGAGPGGPPGPHPSFPGRTLTQPPVMRGEDVRTWQGRMLERGWDLDVDGLYGPASEDVCRRFQKEKDLPVTGAVDRVTWNASWEVPVD
ncbi:peptidoglycan recognition protein family protein [Streptosporangium sp. DT93]|uniref:peptidoglycan recognition protein family protein n=1 Tax=Streptosporangium sp. DT93 TaxID=3393428 RepID=UPI003CE95A7E